MPLSEVGVGENGVCGLVWAAGAASEVHGAGDGGEVHGGRAGSSRGDARPPKFAEGLCSGEARSKFHGPRVTVCP